MTISVRSYLLAGVAAVGATAVALAPVQVLPPDITVAAEQRPTDPATSQQAVELLAAVQGMSTPSAHAAVDALIAVQEWQEAPPADVAPSATLSEPAQELLDVAPAAFPGVENAIIGAYDAIEPWVAWGFGVARWAVQWVPWIGLLAPQITIFYNFGEAIVESVVKNFAHWVGGSVRFGEGLANIGTATGQAVRQLVRDEINWASGWLPPLPPMPLSSTLTGEPAAAAESQFRRTLEATPDEKTITVREQLLEGDDTAGDVIESEPETDEPIATDDELIDDDAPDIEAADNVAPAADRLQKPTEPTKPTLRETLRDRLRSATDSLEKARDLGKPRPTLRRTNDDDGPRTESSTPRGATAEGD